MATGGGREKAFIRQLRNGGLSERERERNVVTTRMGRTYGWEVAILQLRITINGQFHLRDPSLFCIQQRYLTRRTTPNGRCSSNLGLLIGKTRGLIIIQSMITKTDPEILRSWPRSARPRDLMNSYTIDSQVATQQTHAAEPTEKA